MTGPIRQRYRLGIAVALCAAMSGCASLPMPVPSVPFNYQIQPTSVDTPSENAPSQMPVPSHTYTDVTSPDRVVSNEPPTAKPKGFADPPPGSGYSRYYDQGVTWGACSSYTSGQCARVLAPLDWNDPDGQAITLTMRRKTATAALVDPSSPDLFINPGGPGGSAQDYVDYFNSTGLKGYNIVGLDPRGSGESTPVVCGTTAQIDAYFNLDMSPDNDQEKQDLIDGTREFAQQCLQSSGALLDHVSTIEAVYDFDMVRQLLGDTKFNWMGTSYGTFIGAVYLELYPQNAGRMILDAAVSITEGSDDDSDGGVSQADGFELALTKFAEWEVRTGRATSVQSFKTKLTNFIDSLDSKPISVGNRMLTQSLFVTGLATFMYSGTDAYTVLASTLSQTMDQRNGVVMLAMADQMNGRSPSGYSPMATAFPGISCKDWADPGIDAMFGYWDSVSASAPIFGTYFGPDVVCSVWPVMPAAQIDFRGAGDPPFLVIGGTGDNATPYQYAVEMAKQMPAAILVTRNGVGHGSYSSGSSCIDKIVRNFLSKGTLPDQGVTCQMD